jgi:hypothetical protein
MKDIALDDGGAIQLDLDHGFFATHMSAFDPKRTICTSATECLLFRGGRQLRYGSVWQCRVQAHGKGRNGAARTDGLLMSALGLKMRNKADITVAACLLLRSLLGVKRTCGFALQMSAFDPKRTWVLP